MELNAATRLATDNGKRLKLRQKYSVKRNWEGPGFVVWDGHKIVDRSDTKRAAVQIMNAIIDREAADL
jgi:hypothetical protein